MFGWIKLKSGIALCRADIDRLIAAQSPSDKHHRYFDIAHAEGIRNELTSDWESLASAIMAEKSRDSAQRAFVERVNSLTHHHLRRLSIMKTAGMHQEYMWEAALWGYWSLQALSLNPKHQGNSRVTAEISEISQRFARFLNLENEQRAVIATVDKLIGMMPIYF